MHPFFLFFLGKDPVIEVKRHLRFKGSCKCFGNSLPVVGVYKRGKGTEVGVQALARQVMDRNTSSE
jgi:hypothetical protein